MRSYTPNINQGVPDVSVVAENNPAGATGSGTTNTAVLRFLTTTVTGVGLVATDSAANGLSITINRAGTYYTCLTFQMAASRTMDLGIATGLSGVITADPVMTTAGMLAVTKALTPALCEIPCTVSAWFTVTRAQAQVGLVLHFLGTDGAAAVRPNSASSPNCYGILQLVSNII